ncbi:MAG: ferrous iron transporter B [Bacillota bacterium]
MRVALAGNPNSGKTTLYNALTGKNEHAGNWAGVTVDRREAKVRKKFWLNHDMVITDLPGAYSMSPFTSEESITSEFVKNNNPDVIINIVDATNLRRSLFFTTQLLELGIPVVVALNKSDVVAKKGTKIDIEKLANEIGCPVVMVSAVRSKGLPGLISAISNVVGKKQGPAFSAGNVDLTSESAVAASDKARFSFADGVVDAVEVKKEHVSSLTIQDKVDKVIAHKWFGIPIFAAVMFVVFYLSQSLIGPWIADTLVGWLEAGQEALAEALGEGSPFWTSLLVDGIVGGFIAVVGFLPLVMVMYFLIALLEDCGYMTRVAIVMDNLLKKVGLSGKSIIPMVIGTGCAIPGIMACRTIRDERERRVTTMLTPFMPCGAKLPVIALFAGVFFADSWWIGASMYFVGIAIIILAALLIRTINGADKAKTYFIMELPEYKVPNVGKSAMSMLNRAWAFIVKAGTIILVCNAVVQIMSSFTWGFDLALDDASNSILASIASPVAWLLVPIVGVCAWQLAAAAVTGFIAKENVVGTLAVVYSITNFIDTDALELTGGSTEVAAVMGITGAAALAFLMFNLFTPPCFAALGAMNSEMKSQKWLWAGIGMQFGVAYVLAFFVYQFGTLFTTGSVGAGFIWGLLVSLLLIGLVVFLAIRGHKKSKERQLANAIQE